MRWRVLVSVPAMIPVIDEYRSLFTQNDIEIEVPSVIQKLTEAELVKIIDRFDGIIAGDDELTAAVLNSATKLKIISKWGVGIDGIDLKAASRLNIKVTNTPGTLKSGVADAAMGYILCMARKLHLIDKSVRNGRWEKMEGILLQGRTVGVVGVGGVGRELVQRATAFGMIVVGYDILEVPSKFLNDTGLEMVELSELLRCSDFVCLCCSLNEANYHLIGKKELDIMKPEAYLVNISRGQLINEPELIMALENGSIAGAALDVFESEPLPLDSPLRRLENCMLGSHNAFNADNAVKQTHEEAINNLIAGLNAI